LNRKYITLTIFSFISIVFVYAIILYYFENYNYSLSLYEIHVQSPFDIKKNPNNGLIYVSSHESDSVSVIDPDSKTIVETIMVGRGPTGIAINPLTNLIYVANYYSDSISVINSTNNAVIETISVEKTPWGIAVNPNTNFFYVTHYLSNVISIIDGNTNLISKTMMSKKPFEIEINPKTNLIYIGNRESNNMTVIDGISNEIFKIIQVGDDPFVIDPRGIAIDSFSNIIYVSNVDRISIIDGNTNEVISHLMLSGIEPMGISLNPFTNTIVIANSIGNDISIVNLNTNKSINNISLGQHPLHVYFDSLNDIAYITNLYSNTVSVIKNASSIDQSN